MQRSTTPVLGKGLCSGALSLVVASTLATGMTPVIALADETTPLAAEAALEAAPPPSLKVIPR